MSGHRPRSFAVSLLRVQSTPRRTQPRRARRTGFTLVEMMVAVGLTVLMMTMVVTIFGLVMDGIRDSRGAIEVTDRLRAAKTRLQLDLVELTAPLSFTPPLDPAQGLGYFEYIEGPIGPVISPSELAASDTPNPDGSSNSPPDTTVGDNDDILMFTVTSNDEPFIGRAPLFVDLNKGTGNPEKWRWISVDTQSYTAEIVWFVRGNTLYRRTLLVVPNLAQTLPTFNEFQTYVNNLPVEEQADYKSIYQFCDISVHLEGDFSSDTTGGDLRPVPNTLNDLTNRENRYAHQPFAWPHDARLWAGLGLPTTQEYSSGVMNYGSMAGAMKLELSLIDSNPASNTRRLFYPQKQIDGQDFTLIGMSTDPNKPYHCPRLFFPGTYPFPNIVPNTIPFDAWLRPHPSTAQDGVTGQITTNTLRVGEDVILTNVLGFDVKVWDPGAPIITLNDTNRGFNGQTILPTDSLFGAPPDESAEPKMAIAAALDRLDELNATGDNDQIVGYGAYVDLNYMCRLGLASPQMSPPFDMNSAKRTINTTTGAPQFPIQDLDSPNPPKPLNDPVYAMRDDNPPQPQFHHHGDLRSGLFGTFPIASISTDPDDADLVRDLLRPAVYDTFSTAYNTDSINQLDVPWNPARIAGDPVVESAVDSSAWPQIRHASPLGFAGKKQAVPPYPHPLRGIQVKIRVFEPATRQIREVTVEHEVLTQ